MADVLEACAPHSVDTPHKGRQRRAKLDFNVLNDARLKIRKLAKKAGIDFTYEEHGYPHFYYIDDKSKSGVFEISGQRVRQMLDYAVSSDLSALKAGESQVTKLFTPRGQTRGVLTCVDADTFRLSVPVGKAGHRGRMAARSLRRIRVLQPERQADFSAARAGPCVVGDLKKKPACCERCAC